MPIVNTLIVRLEAQTRKFQTGISRATDKLKDFRKNNKTAGDAVRNMISAVAATNPLLAAMAIALVATAGAIIKITHSTAAYVESLQKMSLRIGLSVSAIEQLRFAAEQSGGSLEALLPTFRALARSSFEAAQGTETYKRVYDALGVTVTKRNGQMKDLDSLLEEVADGLLKASNSTERLAAAQQILGRGATALMPLLSGGSAEIRRLREQAVQLGAQIGPAFTKEAADYIDNLNIMKTLLRNFGRLIAGEFLPTFNVFLEKYIATSIKRFQQWQKAIREVRFQTQRFFATLAFGISKLGSFIGIEGAAEQAEAFNAIMREGKEDLDAWLKAQDDAAVSNLKFGEGLDISIDKVKSFSEVLAEVINKNRKTLAQLIEEVIGGETELKAPAAAGGKGPGFKAPGRAIPIGLDVDLSGFEVFGAQVALLFAQTEDLGRKVFNTFSGLLDNLSTGLVEAARGGKVAFGDFFKQMLADLGAAIIRAIILRTILGIFGGFGAGGFFKDILKGGIPAPARGFGGGTQDVTAGAMARTANEPGTAGGMRPVVNVTVKEPSPLTEIEFTERVTVNRLRERQQTLREAF